MTIEEQKAQDNEKLLKQVFDRIIERLCNDHCLSKDDAIRVVLEQLQVDFSQNKVKFTKEQ